MQDYHPAHWDEDAAAALGYPGLVAPLTFTATLAMAANQRLLQEVVVGYDTYVQTGEVFEQHRPIVVGDELRTDVELSSVRRVAGRDMITITNTFVDSAGETVHTMHTTVAGVTADEVDPAITMAVQKVMVHDVDILSVEDAAKEYLKTTRPAGEQRIADGGQTRVPGSLKFDGLSVGDQLPERQMLLSRGDLVNYAGVAGDANPIHWDENIARLAGLPDVIAHGMLTLGLGAGFVSSWSGDPGRSASIRYDFRLQPWSRPMSAGTLSSVAGSNRSTRTNEPGLSSSAQCLPARRSSAWRRWTYVSLNRRR